MAEAKSQEEETRGLYQKNDVWWFQPPMKDGRRPRPFSLETKDLGQAILNRRDVLLTDQDFLSKRTPAALEVLTAHYHREKISHGGIRRASSENIQNSMRRLLATPC